MLFEIDMDVKGRPEAREIGSRWVHCTSSQVPSPKSQAPTMKYDRQGAPMILFWGLKHKQLLIVTEMHGQGFVGKKGEVKFP